MLGEVARILSLFTGPVTLLIFFMHLFFNIAFVFLLIINPKDERREADLAQELKQNCDRMPETETLLEKGLQ